MRFPETATRRDPLALADRRFPSRLDRLLIWLGVLRPHWSDRERVAVSALFVAAVAAWLAALSFMATVPFTGDEVTYNIRAATIARFLTLQGVTLEQVLSEVVRYGWFMPGVPLVLTPLYVVDATPAVAVVRLYAALLNFALWLWALREVARGFGRPAARALLVFPALAATWLFFSSTIWGDLSAGLLLAVIAARTFRLACAIFEERPLSLRDILVLELILVAAVYIRGNTILVVAAVHVFLFALCLISGRWRQLGRRTAALVLGAAVFASLLAPWSLTASRLLGGTVITTSTVPLAFGVTFGRGGQICFGPCPKGLIWGRAVEFSRVYGKEHGISQLEAQRRMAAHALRDTTPAIYARRVFRNFGTFLSEPSAFAQRFLRSSGLRMSPELVQAALGVVQALTMLLYAPFLLCLLAVNFVVWRVALQAQLASLVVKMLTLCLFAQPFVHPSHQRYWPGFAPLMALSGGLLYAWWRERRASSRVASGAPTGAGSGILTFIQAAYVAAVLGGAAALAAIAR